jgi:hypothetical protein
MKKELGEIIMLDDTPIKSSWFYIHESERTKLNWFLYEYACTLYMHMKGGKNEVLQRWKSRRSNKQLAEFCAYFSKRMKQSIYDRLSGLTVATVGNEDYVFDLCHTNTAEENGAILDVVESSWDELLAVCEICPERCISERDEYSAFFDRMESR